MGFSDYLLSSGVSTIKEPERRTIPKRTAKVFTISFDLGEKLATPVAVLLRTTPEGPEIVNLWEDTEAEQLYSLMTGEEV